jgi:hypothetical protein
MLRCDCEFAARDFISPCLSNHVGFYVDGVWVPLHHNVACCLFELVHQISAPAPPAVYEHTATRVDALQHCKQRTLRYVGVGCRSKYFAFGCASLQTFDCTFPLTPVTSWSFLVC